MPDERPCLAGWKVPIARYLDGMDRIRCGIATTSVMTGNTPWSSRTLSQATVARTRAAWLVRAPVRRKTSAVRIGYAEFLQAIRDARHPEHDAMAQWVGGSFDPHAFSPHSITFDNPRERWQIAFERWADQT